MTSVPPLKSDPFGEPPPWYSGDQPTVPNPVYRGPGADGQNTGTSPTNGSADEAPAPASGAGSAEASGASNGSGQRTGSGGAARKDDVGRRGNLVMGGMLVAGMIIVGAAFAMVSGSGSGADGGAETAAADGDDGQTLAAATPGAVDRETGDDAEGSDGAGGGDSSDETAGAAVELPEPAAFGETVRVLDGVAVTTSETRAFDPAEPPDAAVDGYLAADVTVVNGAGEEVQMLPVVHLVDDLAEIEPYLDGTELEATGHPQVVDEARGVSESWSGADMELGSTAFGTFGFGLLPAEGDPAAGPFLVVWVDGGDGTPVPVAFGGT